MVFVMGAAMAAVDDDDDDETLVAVEVVAWWAWVGVGGVDATMVSIRDCGGGDGVLVFC